MSGIRYAFGESSLGGFIAATSSRGLVAFEFNQHPQSLVGALRDRFPDARAQQDGIGLSETVQKLVALVERPWNDPGLDVDIRGTDYQKRVWEILRRIPAGQTTNYGAVAAELGTRDARDATEAITANTLAILIPCHRVVKKDGSLSGYRWGAKRKRELLAREQNAIPFRLG